jgi:hypothetical protein
MALGRPKVRKTLTAAGLSVLVLFMVTAAEKIERQDRILAELSELGLVLACDLQACALAADAASDKADLSLAFQRTSRSVRQTLALEAKLERDRQTAEREHREGARRAEAFRVARRKAQVKLAVERCVWAEADGDEAETLLADLDDRLERDALADAFAGDDPVDDHIARLCAELGVDTPETKAARTAEAENVAPAPANPAADAPAGADPAPAWRSSG